MPKLVAVALLAIQLVACIPPEPDNDRLINYDEETVMGEVQARGRLVVGLPTDQRPFAFEENDRAQGFLADLGAWVADELGVEVAYEFAAPDVLLAMVDSEQVDIVFPNVEMTERKVRSNIAFTDPYFVGHQRLLVPRDSEIDDVEALAGRRICQFVDDETGVSAESLVDGVEVFAASEPGQCQGVLGHGMAEAATAVDVFLVQILAGLRNAKGCTEPFECDGKIVGDQLTTVGYGAVVEPGASGWVEFVNTTFAEAENEGRWTESYERWIAPYYPGRTSHPPALTAEEATALFPQDT